ncbi:transcription factor MUTE [Panicum miliaceum]|uniref:Transcription factor MUTE n=1 Tax=Panicum miliaceum TaxID=4540 RepID=A0A3L6SHX6_PANMI|nr:transcription factor MUTE [Panicum miliaceum]
MSHIAVERNRRRQMNDHLKVLRSLTPALYIKRGDQASIIGGAIDFIRELQQLLDSLEARKKRRSSSTGSHGFSPSPTPSPRSHLGALSSSGGGTSSTPSPPVLVVGRQHQQALAVKELAACCNSPAADVEARISGANVLLRTLSRRAPGQAARMVALLEALHLEVLHLNISTMEDTVLHSFVLKIGLECQLSVEDLAYEVQQTFVCFREQEQQEQPDHELQQENLMYSAMAI